MLWASGALCGHPPKLRVSLVAEPKHNDSYSQPILALWTPHPNPVVLWWLRKKHINATALKPKCRHIGENLSIGTGSVEMTALQFYKPVVIIVAGKRTYTCHNPIYALWTTPKHRAPLKAETTFKMMKSNRRVVNTLWSRGFIWWQNKKNLQDDKTNRIFPLDTH